MGVRLVKKVENKGVGVGGFRPEHEQKHKDKRNCNASTDMDMAQFTLSVNWERWRELDLDK